MNILFYTPVNFRCRDIESLAEKFIHDKHKVFFLSHSSTGPFHDAMKHLGADVTARDTTGIYRRLSELITYCRTNKIEVCFSHLEPTNFISVLAQYFLKTRFIIYRHHIDEAKLNGFDRSLAYRWTYKLAKTIVCVSRQAKEYMINVEHVSASRIFHINLGYNFDLYPLPAKKLRTHTGIRLLSAGRLNRHKRPNLSLELLKRAVDSGIDCSIVFLGVGEEETSLRHFATENSIADRVTFVGYTHQILDYLSEADVLVHPSVLESSCVVVKEASLVNLPVIICSGIGDFDDYMKNGVNGIVVSKDRFVEESLVNLKRLSQDTKAFREMATRLREEILSRFSIDNTYPQYKKLLGI